MRYEEKLRDPRWQRKRLEVFQRDNWRCVICGRDNETLHVHHLEYDRSGDPWNVPLCHLQTLCETCHERKHNPSEGLRESIIELLEECRRPSDLRAIYFLALSCAKPYQFVSVMDELPRHG